MYVYNNAINIANFDVFLYKSNVTTNYNKKAFVCVCVYVCVRVYVVWVCDKL